MLLLFALCLCLLRIYNSRDCLLLVVRVILLLNFIEYILLDDLTIDEVHLGRRLIFSEIDSVIYQTCTTASSTPGQNSTSRPIDIKI